VARIVVPANRREKCVTDDKIGKRKGKVCIAREAQAKDRLSIYAYFVVRWNGDEEAVVQLVNAKNISIDHVNTTGGRCNHEEFRRKGVGIHGDKPLGRCEGKEETCCPRPDVLEVLNPTKSCTWATVAFW